MTTTLIEITPVVAIALEVIAGKWGNGIEREEALRREGYNAVKIQKCVNDLVTLMEKYGG